MDAAPLYSICVPQYGRSEHFIAALRSFAAQNFRDFEVVVSDGGSPDGGIERVRAELQALGLRHVLSVSPERLRYDANLRRAIGLSSGRWCVLMGNDDGCSDADALGDLAAAIASHQPVAAAYTNYRELPHGRVFRRAQATAVVGEGEAAAIAGYRSFAFVSGVVLDGPRARALATDQVDGSEMYQMYLVAALLAEGGRLLGVDRVCIDKDLQVPGASVESFRTAARADADAFIAKPLPMVRLADTVLLGIKAGAGAPAAARAVWPVARQLYRYTFPFWAVEWRRALPLRHALRMYFKLRPSQVLAGHRLPFPRRMQLWFDWSLRGLVGVCMPVRVFDRLQPYLYRLAKRGSSA